MNPNRKTRTPADVVLRVALLLILFATPRTGAVAQDAGPRGAIDGVVTDSALSPILDPTPNLSDTVSPRDLAGIEVYTSIASVPLRYRSAGNASACGVILLWTKRG